MSRIAVDTNILAYAAGIERVVADAPKVAAARRLLSTLDGRFDFLIPVQVIGELFNVARRSLKDDTAAREIARGAERLGQTSATSVVALNAAMDLATQHHLQIWDALIVSVAADAGCSLLLSEDMQDGFAVGGMTVVNPFVLTPHPALAAVLFEADQLPGSP